MGRVPLALGLLILAVGWPGACARPRATEYARADAAASRAYGHGRYDEAAAEWLAAASVARRPRDAEEARYRAAKSFARAGHAQTAEALLDELAADSEGERAARAAYDRAELELEGGRSGSAAALRDRALRRYPNSGLAARALQRQLAWHVEQGGPAAALAYLDSLASAVGNSELAEALLYERAAQLAAAGDPSAALAAYLETAERFPYPYGAYWDDALYHAAELEVVLGQPEAAIAELQRMLAAREARPLTGSLERPRFGPARYLIAEIRRDELGDLAGARRDFLRLVDEHPTSRLRDDALWSAAKIASQLGDTANACHDAQRLLRELGTSRYVGCVRHLCPTAVPPRGSRCPSYVASSDGPADRR